MIIKRNIDDYLISTSLNVRSALQKLDETTMQILFIVDNKKKLHGVLTDGDIRRWLLSAKNPDLNTNLLEVINNKFTSRNIKTSPEDIERLFNGKIKTIPLVDDDQVLMAVAESKSLKIKIGKRLISNSEPSFIIAEIGNNHQGNINIAKELVDACSEAGVDSCKFQMRTMGSLYKNKSDSVDITADLGSQYTLDLLSKFQLSDDDLFEVLDYTKQKGLIPLCTPWDLESLEKLDNYGVEGFKIASADFTNYELLEAASKTHKPLICSTGMSSQAEILDSSKFLKKLGAEVIYLHCNSTYPTPFKDINLNYLNVLKKSTDSFIGYSGHERGYVVPLAAISLGAKVIEKHITLDKSQEGNDHKVSLTPSEFKKMVKHIREIEESMGVNNPREISQGELLNREVLAKSLVSNKDIKKGDQISRDMIVVKSPGNGLQPNKINEIIGKKANRNISKGDFFFDSDLKSEQIVKRDYCFDRPFGVPVRYHDFDVISNGINLDFVEFHLSYQDLNERPSNYLNNRSIGFSVHAPELFENDHILDLCSEDQEYRNISINNLKKVIDHVKLISENFDQTEPPILIVNAGGWSTENFISIKDKSRKYDILKNSFSKIDLTDVKLAIQTMPPFPWHFGGQSFHNLFVDPDEINNFCSATDLSVCLDISHSMMACNYYGWSLNEFISKISKHIKYLHIVDAIGSDGEGVQIGNGDVDFAELGKVLRKNCKNIPFIPEIWQGHKNEGSSFWEALNFLEPYFQIK